uniref:Distal tail protein n=1 Tax=Myoviridae sp. ctBvM24 TaxID=2825050 RepID=A0A8S5UCU7_9CAUD|nr:MAG TPA: distal tail protein [Myoviridae sp. ctBvM24]
MKVNGIDARKYNAKQLTAEVLPPSLSVDYEIITGAILPTEFETDMQLGSLNLCMYFRGKDRNALIRNMSAFLENFTKSCVLEVDGYKGKFKGFTASSDYTKMKVKTRYQLNVTVEGYFYDDELNLEYDGITETTIDRQGTRSAPVIIEVYAKKALKDYKISGFEDDIIVEQLAAGQTIVIDGEEGRITKDGADAFGSVDLWRFPAITEKQTALKFSSPDAIVRIRYKPMWL